MVEIIIYWSEESKKSTHILDTAANAAANIHSIIRSPSPAITTIGNRSVRKFLKTFKSPPYNCILVKGGKIVQKRSKIRKRLKILHFKSQSWLSVPFDWSRSSHVSCFSTSKDLVPIFGKIGSFF